MKLVIPCILTLQYFEGDQFCTWEILGRTRSTLSDKSQAGLSLFVNSHGAGPPLYSYNPIFFGGPVLHLVHIKEDQIRAKYYSGGTSKENHPVESF